MINKIRIFYRNNSMWMSLARSIFISLTLAIVVILIDSKMILGINYIPSFLLTSVELAKLILSTLAGSLLTITTFTFSTIMVVLTTYSSDFSPRVVNNFITDKITMKVLGIFIGGFFYCILTLFFMRNTFSAYSVLSATIAVLYAALCIMYFVIFVFRVSSSIQATTLIGRIYDESDMAIEEMLKYRKNQTSSDSYDVEIFKHKLQIVSGKSGYLEMIGFSALLNTLKDIDTKLIIKEDIGTFVSIDQVVANLYYNEDLEDDYLIHEILKDFTIQKQRIAYSDYRFSLQKIVDITLRAISPGINDPNTAIHCINILGVLLNKLGNIQGKYTVIKKENCQSEIIYKSFDFKEDLYFTFYQIVHYGKGDISVVLAILNILKNINNSSSDDKTIIIEEFADYVYMNSIGNFTHELDIKILNTAREAV